MGLPLLSMITAGAVAPVLVLPTARRAPDVSVEELVERARQADEGARYELYQRNVRVVAARVTRLLARSEEAEDVVQETFLQAFRDLTRLREPAHFAPWLMGIAIHQAHRRLRRRRLLQRLGMDRGEDDSSLEKLTAPDATPEQRLPSRQLQTALDELDAGVRLAWMLRLVEGCELREVAVLCGCSVATAKRRVQRARDYLAGRLGEDPNPEIGR